MAISSLENLYYKNMLSLKYHLRQDQSLCLHSRRTFMENYKNPISLFKQTNFSNTIWWKLKVNISGFQNETGNNLVTQIFKNRIFKLIYPNIHQGTCKISRILVQLYEDGYVCWINLDGLIIEEYKLSKTENFNIKKSFIKDNIPSILKWIKAQAELNNKYLWGGTLGPNFDCSGLIQTAFLKHKINIPRDSYQIKSFCKHLLFQRIFYSSSTRRSSIFWR